LSNLPWISISRYRGYLGHFWAWTLTSYPRHLFFPFYKHNIQYHAQYQGHHEVCFGRVMQDVEVLLRAVPVGKIFSLSEPLISPSSYGIYSMPPSGSSLRWVYMYTYRKSVLNLTGIQSLHKQKWYARYSWVISGVQTWGEIKKKPLASKITKSIKGGGWQVQF
jgi:hypothetical protein